jgi:predicted Ser/Thr protein kinase
MYDGFEIQTWIKRHGRAVYQALGKESFDGAFRVRTIASGRHSLVFELTAGGRRVLVKSFDPDWDGSPRALKREAACLSRLGPAGLSPSIKGFDEDALFFVSDFVDGSTISEELDEASLTRKARDMGHWFARFSALMPARTIAHTSWLEYLDRYDAVLTHQERDIHRDMLSALPIERTVIAKNDGFLGNFIVAEDGSLVGIDFESATYKPLGWDILINARVLARRFPGRIDDIASALVAGWNQGTDCIGKEDLRRLAVSFALLTAFKDLDSPEI